MSVLEFSPDVASAQRLAEAEVEVFSADELGDIYALLDDACDDLYHHEDIEGAIRWIYRAIEALGFSDELRAKTAS